MKTNFGTYCKAKLKTIIYLHERKVLQLISAQKVSTQATLVANMAAGCRSVHRPAARP